MKYNQNFFKLSGDYVFSELSKKVAKKRLDSKTEIIDLGIGDVRLPLFDCVISAMQSACREMGTANGFKGYPPAQGYPFLREKISQSYKGLGTEISADEVFITDGAKGQLGSITELFDKKIRVLFPTPCYPAGAEANIFLGNEVELMPTSRQDGFIPYPPPSKDYDLIYLCSPNNPTGATLSHSELKLWVNYALSCGSVIIFDGAYSSFVSDDLPRSIYEISNAKHCAIEICSFSKSLGFTGIRCGYTVIPNELGRLNELWKRRISSRFNGVSYISQRGAEAFFSPEGIKATQKRINFYKTNAEILKIALKNLNLWYNNTVCSPYVFGECPNGVSSSDFCDRLLDELSIVATPGTGFLKGGEGFFRLSAFSKREQILNASDRLRSLKTN